MIVWPVITDKLCIFLPMGISLSTMNSIASMCISLWILPCASQPISILGYLFHLSLLFTLIFSMAAYYDFCQRCGQFVVLIISDAL